MVMRTMYHISIHNILETTAMRQYAIIGAQRVSGADHSASTIAATSPRHQIDPTCE
jgi:hypothetical protein